MEDMAAKDALKSSVCDKVPLSQSEIYSIIKNLMGKDADKLQTDDQSKWDNCQCATCLLHIEKCEQVRDTTEA